MTEVRARRARGLPYHPPRLAASCLDSHSLSKYQRERLELT